MLKWARIFLIIFSRAELRWIYKDTDNRGSIGTRKPLRSIDEGKVSLMKGSHGGHEDYRSRQPSAESLHSGNRFNYSHRKRSSCPFGVRRLAFGVRRRRGAAPARSGVNVH